MAFLPLMLFVVSIPGFADIGSLTEAVEKAARSAAAEAKKEDPKLATQVRDAVRQIGSWLAEPRPDDAKALREFGGKIQALLQQAGGSVGSEAEQAAAQAFINIIKQRIPPEAFQDSDPNRSGSELAARAEISRIQADRDARDAAAQRDWAAINFYRRNDPVAFRYFNRAIDAGDLSPETLTMLGRAAYHLGDYALAMRAGQMAREQESGSSEADVLVKLAEGKVSKINLQSALVAVGASNPADGVAVAGVVDPLEQRQRAELAAVAARRSVVAPSKVQQSALIAKDAAHFLRIGDYPGAYARATEAIDLNNLNAQAWNYRAMAATNLRRYSDAVYDASYAINLEASQAPAWVTRSWAFAKQGNYREAERDARAALEKAPGNGYAYHNLAFALAGEGRREEAIAALRRAAEQDARFKPQLEQALQLAQNEDMTLLFADAPVQAAGAAPASASPVARKNRFIRMALLSIIGGLIVALGLFHNLSANWREQVQATIRRALAASGEGRAAEESAAAVADRAPPASGAFWEQYELLREIGSGGMGLVYEARDRALDRRVAVKRMRDEIRADPVERRRFVQEAKTVAALHHPNIVDIYAIVEQDQDVFLVFEFVAGKTLADRLRAGALSFAEARRVMSAVAQAVGYAHKQKIIHRDLTPSNIMLADDRTVKVMDFGVARQAKDAVTKMSMTNTIVGTPPYMAPEQEQGSVRSESDVFALGVVLYEALCGELPFVGAGAGMLLNKINGKHLPLSSRASAPLPLGLDAVIAKALAPDPDTRYRTPGELSAALDALVIPVG